MRAPDIVRALAVGAALAGCAQEQGSGSLTGFLSVPGCVMAPAGAEACTGAETDPPEICEHFDMHPNFFTLETAADDAVVRMQYGGEDFARADGLQLHVRDVRGLPGRLGVPLAVGPDEPVRGALDLFERCPEGTESLELRGRVTFESFGLHKGDRVSGTIDELLVRDARTGALRGRLHGDFDFTVRRGPPYRRFVGR
ncbi:hypothetical protein L6V77_12240 [Myxococcota bacterium]|nr:hypothetical protein [Myxococcota bacterium]